MRDLTSPPGLSGRKGTHNVSEEYPAEISRWGPKVLIF